MKRSGLWVVGVAALVGVMTLWPQPRDAEHRRSAPVRSSLPAGVQLNPSQAAEAQAELARPFATWRLRETVQPGRIDVRGRGYTAQVASDGLRFAAGGRSMRMRTSSISQGGRSLPCAGTELRHAGFGQTRIDRHGVVEEYLFENDRVEQLFHLAAPVALEGNLEVRVAVETNLDGPVREIPRSTEGRLRGAELVFSDAAGKTRFRYHGAVAYDAKGDKIGLDPRMDGNEIVLAVPADFLQKAAYPVVVDPFLQLDESSIAGGMSETTAVSQQPAIAIEGGGNPYVAWSEEVLGSSGLNFEIFFRYWNGLAWVDLGGSDQDGGISNNPGNSTNPAIGLEGNGLGTVLIAWQDDTSGNFEIFLRRWDGTTWSELEKSADPGGGLSLTAGESRNPTIGFVTAFSPFSSPPEAKQAPVVAWEDTSLGLTEIFALMFYFGDPGDETFGFDPVPAGWYEMNGSAGSVVGAGTGSVSVTGPGVSERPRMVTDNSNRVSIAWQDSIDVFAPTSTFEILFRRFTPSAVMLGTIQLNPGQTYYPDPRAPLGLVQIGGAWQTITGGAGSNNLSGTAGPAPAGMSIHPSMSIDRFSGDIWVAWEESLSATNREIFAVRSLGGAAAFAGVGGSATGGGISANASLSTNPSIAVDSTLRPAVAWVDEASGNTEIFLRQLQGGAWVELGIGGNSASPDGPAPNVGGVSKTFAASLNPSAQIGGGSPVVAWQDFADGNFEIFVKRFYVTEPRSARQITTDPVLLADVDPANDIIATGGGTDQLSIDLRCTPFHEFGRATLMQVEVKPVNVPFDGKDLRDSALVATSAVTGLPTVAGAECSVLFTGLNNVSYKWRYRTVDDVGQISPWFDFGGNAQSAADWIVSSIPPAPPTAPGTLSFSIGAGPSVDLTWVAASGSPTSYNIYRISPGPGAFAGGVVIASPAGSATSFSDTGVTPGTTYSYQVTAVNAAGEGAPSGEITVSVPTNAVPGGGASSDDDDSEVCGLTGLEAVLALAGLAILRRRRRA
jgi:hypothetical protein